MKRAFSFVVMLFSLSFAFNVLAQAPDAGAPSQAVSAEDVAKMREQIAQLSKAMGNPSPSNSKDEHKTVGDVADKALDMLSGVAATVSTNLQKVAPELWRVMIRQQYAKAVAGVAEPGLLLLGTIIFMCIMRKLWKSDGKKPDSEGDIAKYIFRSIVPASLSVIFGIWLAIGVSESARYVINPEYYAVKDILIMVTNPTQAP